MFNEKAVLESYHSFLLMELLRKPETDILEGFSVEVQQAARQRIVRAILATDPAFHFQLADELEALKAANPDINGPATLLDEKTKDACLMRAGDVDERTTNRGSKLGRGLRGGNKHRLIQFENG